MDKLSGNRGLFAAARNRMVREQLAELPPRVRAAMEKVPRHKFVPKGYQLWAYANMPLPIGYGQSISQPYIVALMTAQLEPQPADRVLEIGTGSGYQAAILAELVAEVYSIEIIEPLAERARSELQKLGYQNVHLRIGDGFTGWPEAAPFDAIIATCAPQQIPPPLIEQLKDGGRFVIPIGLIPDQELKLFQKTQGRLESHAIVPVRFVPMTGKGGNPGCLD
jgi:protein-L-isoaspartate(D-aspartate) O-methyltransferase